MSWVFRISQGLPRLLDYRPITGVGVTRAPAWVNAIGVRVSGWWGQVGSAVLPDRRMWGRRCPGRRMRASAYARARGGSNSTVGD